MSKGIIMSQIENIYCEKDAINVFKVDATEDSFNVYFNIGVQTFIKTNKESLERMREEIDVALASAGYLKNIKEYPEGNTIKLSSDAATVQQLDSLKLLNHLSEYQDKYINKLEKDLNKWLWTME